ncbi:MAG: DNA primase [Acidobacteriaceae bacterium]
MPADFAQSVKEQADIVKIIGEYVRLRKAGAQNYSGLCPFHKEKTPSFSVHAGRQFYHCFGCGQSGDVFSFVQKIENVPFPEAVRTVARKCGIPLPQREFTSPEEAAEHRQRGKLLDLHEVATAWFEEQLRSPEGATAREYLTGRGLNSDGITKFRIGFAPDNFHALRQRLEPLADPATLRASGLFSWKDQEDGSPGPMYARFRKRVMFPIANEGGRVIAFTARTLETGEKAGPKYLNSPETPLYSKGNVLFNLDKARQAIRSDGGVVLVEGQMDCISVFLAGIPNVLATSGTALTETQIRVLSRILGDKQKRVIANFDSDTAGISAGEKYIFPLLEEGFEVRVFISGDGLDPDRYIRERGARAYAEALRSAPAYDSWLINRARERFPGRDPKSKSEAFNNFLVPYIRHVRDPIQKEAFLSDAAQALGIDPMLARAVVKDAAARRGDSLAVHHTPLTRDEQILVQAFAAPRSAECYSVAEGAWHQHERELAALRPDVRAMIDQLRARPSGADALACLATEEHRRILAALFLSIHDAEPQADTVEKAVLEIRRRALEEEKRQVRLAIDAAQRSGNLQEALTLTSKTLELDRLLSDLK